MSAHDVRARVIVLALLLAGFVLAGWVPGPARAADAPPAAGLPAAGLPSAGLPAGCTPWASKSFVHPPLKCFETFTRIDGYPVVAWCFHGMGIRGSMPFDEAYARNALDIGFNVLIDDARMLEPCRKVGGIKVVVPQFWAPPEKLKAGIFEPYGDHPCLMGLVLDDNCSSIHPEVARNGKWITENYPHIMPWISENPNAGAQSKTTVRVLGTQNYPFLRGARGERATAGYCDGLNHDRVFGNNNNMSYWTCFGGHNPFNQVRFQMTAALAYGCQGLVNFAYTPHRTKQYMPGNEMVPQFKKMHTYIIDVLGRHLWGTRCMEVIHSVHGGSHRGAPTPDAGKLVVNMSEFSLVGLLTPEARFRSKNPEDRAVPEYFMIVDKRTGGGTPEMRDSFVMLSLSVPAVEMLDSEATADSKVRKIVPGYKVRMKTEGGDGLLVRVPPDLGTLLGGREGLKLYDEVNKVMAALQWKINPPPAPGQPTDEKPSAVAREDAARAAAAGVAKAAELERVLATAVKAGTVSKAQAQDTITRLKKAIEATAAEAEVPLLPK